MKRVNTYYKENILFVVVYFIPPLHTSANLEANSVTSNIRHIRTKTGVYCIVRITTSNSHRSWLLKHTYWRSARACTDFYNVSGSTILIRCTQIT